MVGKSNPSMTNVVLLVSFVMTLSHIPILFADSPQGYQEQGFLKGLLDWISPIQIVQIRNNVGRGEHITIHCKSEDDDLGTHVLSFGQSFQWKFRKSYWNTRFFCSVMWHEHYLDFNAFVVNEIEKGKRKTSFCSTTCVWLVMRPFIKSPEGKRLHWK